MLLTAPLIKQVICDWDDEGGMRNSGEQPSAKHSAFQQLHFEDESGISWDDGRESFTAVSIVRRAGQLGHLAQTHLRRM